MSGRLRSAALPAAVLALALPAARSVSASPAAPVLGRDWKTRTIAYFDPVSLARVPGRSVPGGFFTGPWAWDADHTRIALGRSDWPQLRIVDARRMRLAGDVRLRHLGTAGGVDGLTWAGPNRLLALVHGPVTGVAFVLVDSRKLTVLRTVGLSGSQYDVEPIRGGLVALLGPVRGIGTARIAVARADGTVRTAPLPGVSVGTRRTGTGTDPNVRTVIPGFAADPGGAVAVAVTAGNRAVSVDLRTLTASTHQLAPRTVQQAAKSLEGPQRYARWVGDGLLAVGGTDWSRTADGKVSARAAGVRLVDTRSWTTRTLDAEASAFSLARGLVLTYGGSWSGTTQTYTGVHAYAPDGELRWSLYEGQDAYAPVHGSLAYVQRYVGTNRPDRLDVVDPATGTILGARNWRRGQAIPTLYAGDRSS
jgi:hypothetical protein